MRREVRKKKKSGGVENKKKKEEGEWERKKIALTLLKSANNGSEIACLFLSYCSFFLFVNNDR